MVKRDYYILWLLKFLLAACLAVPLLASVSFIFPYTAPKVLGFRFLVETAVVLYFYLALKYPALRPRRTVLFWAVSIFLSVSFLAAVFGVDFYASFWGNLERGTGIWSLVHFAVWFLMLAAVFKEPKDRAGLIKFSVLVGVLVAVTAFIQRFGGLGGLLPPTGRVYGLVGNAGILGSYLIFNVFLAVYLFFVSEGRHKWIFGGSALWLIWALFLTGTRGAYLGFLAGIVVGLLLAIFFGEGKLKKYSLIIIAAIFILTLSLFLSRELALVKNHPVLSRLALASLGETTIQSRLLIWQGAWQAWQSRPMLGFGPESFEVGTAKYLPPRLAELEAYATDRAHNFIFDYGVASGWLGLLGYLSVVGAAAWLLWRKRRDDFIFPAVFISLLAAYLVQNFFIFDSFVSYLMLFFVLAMIVAKPFGEGVNEENQLIVRQKRGSLVKKIIYLFAVVCLLLSVYFYNFKPLLAAYRASQILSLPPAEAAVAAPQLKNVLALKSFASPEITYQVVLDYIDKINQLPVLAQNGEFYNVAAGELAKAISRSPRQARNYLALAWLDLYFSGAAPQKIGEAIELGARAKDLSPNKKDAYLVLAAGYALAGQADKAQEIISQAAAIDGKMGEAVRKYWESLK